MAQNHRLRLEVVRFTVAAHRLNRALAATGLIQDHEPGDHGPQAQLSGLLALCLLDVTRACVLFGTLALEGDDATLAAAAELPRPGEP